MSQQLGMFGEEPAEMIREADISRCEHFRYSLTRRWEMEGDTILWVMLNPSTADGIKDDNTIRKITKYTKRFGASALIVVNLFAYRATDPKELKRLAKDIDKVEAPRSNIIGPSNDTTLLYLADNVANKIIVAWGANGTLWSRDQAVLRLLKGHDLYCLNTTRDGHPCHPLYQRDDEELKVFSKE